MKPKLAVALVIAALIGIAIALIIDEIDEGKPVLVTPTSSPDPRPGVKGNPKPTSTRKATRPPIKTTKPSPKPVPEKTEEPEEEVKYYANCRQMRFDFPNGVNSSHPSYRRALDRDRDGRACETD